MPATAGRDADRRSARSKWRWLLVLPALVPLITVWYNRSGPSLLGFPFFYWAQLASIGLVWLATLAIHQATKGR
jgi:Protein of unknown function (DUF3311)